jgi:hypothetical protein
MRARNLLGAFACATAVLAGSVHAESPDPATHWLSLINTTHREPGGMKVIVVPPAYLSQQAMIGNLGWLGSNPLLDHPGVQAALEAIDYWDWMLHDGPFAPSHLAGLSWTVSVLGVDATPEDLVDVDIVVETAMVTDPLPFVFHLGIGLPTFPPDDFLIGPPGTYSQDVCTVINTGVGSDARDEEPARLRNLVLHEFGHCIGAGHTGTSLDLEHQSRDGTIYESHPTDPMSVVSGEARQCLSNLNVQSIAEGYAFLPGPWQGHDGETFMPRSQYATACMPGALERF